MAELCTLIDAYFNYIKGEYQLEDRPSKKADEPAVLQKVAIREAEPATITGLIFHLGLNSREEFEELQQKGKYAAVLKRARLRVEGAYEKKLLQQTSGIIFALKSFGWNDKPVTEKTAELPKNLTVTVVESQLKPVSDEKDVTL
jgi:hypothetical protein